MTKKEMMMQQIEWKIEDANKEIEDALRSIKAESETTNYAAISAVGIQHNAMKIAEAQTKLRQLYETKHMIEALADEQ